MKGLRLVKNRGYKIRFAQLKGCIGLCDYDSKVIYIDTIAHFVDTFVHEYLHVRHPNLSERKIEQMALRVRCRMNAKDQRKMARLICREAVK